MYTSISKYTGDLSIIDDEIVYEKDDHDGHAYSAAPREGAWFYNGGERYVYYFQDGAWESAYMNVCPDFSATWPEEDYFDYSEEAQYMARLSAEEMEFIEAEIAEF